MQKQEGEQVNRESLQQNRKYLEDLLKRRFYYSQAFELYNGVAGLYDYGPQGCQVMNNIIQLWREHFVLEEDMLEISCTNITPESVLKASGHVDRFTDLMVKDKVNGNAYRADKLLIEQLEKILVKEAKTLTAEKVLEIKQVIIQCESLSSKEMDEVIKKYKIKSIEGNEVSECQPFNLMFSTQIGPTGTFQGYLRPETAQGIFLNFNKLLEFNGGRLPFAGAQIGLGFRNEISPRMGLLRVREFMMAEIEYFIDPQDKVHKRFPEVHSLQLNLLTKQAQQKAELENKILVMSLGEAYEQKIIQNQNLGYFLGRTYLFLKELGFNDNNIRFRQHMDNEMAHYASDCWDAEIETSYGWVECIGHADRSAFDLTCHSKATGYKLQAARKLKEQKQVEQIEIIKNNQLIGKTFKKDANFIKLYLENMEQQEIRQLMEQLLNDGKAFLTIEGQQFEFDTQMLQFKNITVTIQDEKFVPQVIEPSFGIGRLVYCVLEHSFRLRDQKRTYLLLPPRIAPVKCSLLSVVSSDQFRSVLLDIKRNLTKKGISCKMDDGNATIGKRYARTDELGIPFAITVDNNTIQKDHPEFDTVTLREIQTLSQIRIPISHLYNQMLLLSNGQVSWQQITQQYPPFILNTNDS